jgi:hypothetical protein
MNIQKQQMYEIFYMIDKIYYDSFFQKMSSFYDLNLEHHEYDEKHPLNSFVGFCEPCVPQTIRLSLCPEYFLASITMFGIVRNQGLFNYDPLEVYLTIFLHESVHMLIIIACISCTKLDGNRFESHPDTFKNICYNLFGFTSVYHSLDNDYRKLGVDMYQIEIGDEIEGYMLRDTTKSIQGKVIEKIDRSSVRIISNGKPELLETALIVVNDVLQSRRNKYK